MWSLGGGCGSVCSGPGKMKSRGKTERDALTPPHPEQSNMIANAMQKPLHLQFNFTEPYTIVRKFMLAISNSWNANPAAASSSHRKNRFLPVITLCGLLTWMLAGDALA